MAPLMPRRLSAAVISRLPHFPQATHAFKPLAQVKQMTSSPQTRQRENEFGGMQLAHLCGPWVQFTHFRNVVEAHGSQYIVPQSSHITAVSYSGHSHSAHSTCPKLQHEEPSSSSESHSEAICFCFFRRTKRVVALLVERRCGSSSESQPEDSAEEYKTLDVTSSRPEDAPDDDA